ncbi:MAG: BspA family leucine-rich repeat surface protein [Lachnospiraceae bacterium]|nr:BspA family leucine-rich repeat surface protein [Lachnospiraceae bacterium]
MDIKNKQKSNRIINGNKGFTLVELIVVLVIIAILAAIAVPALMGFIDNAHEKNVIANARTALSATQAALSDIYSSNDNCYDDKKREATRIKAGADTTTAFTVWNVRTLRDTKIGTDPETHAITEEIGSYTVGKAVYKENEKTYAAYNGSDWVIYGSYKDATDAIGVSDEDDNTIFVWPYTLYQDYAYQPEEKDPDIEYADYTEDKEPLKTKTVILKIDRQGKSRFVDEAVSSNKLKKILLTFTLFNDDSTECTGWVPDETEANRFFIGGSFLRLMMPSDIYKFATWEDEEGEGTFNEPVSMGRYVFSEAKADVDTVTFFAKLDVEDGGKTATLSKKFFTDFLNDNNTAMYTKNGNEYKQKNGSKQTTAFTRVATDSIGIEDFQANTNKYRKVDDGATDCSIYVWYEGSTLCWWSDAMEKTEEEPEDHVFMPVDCSNLLALRNFTNFDFTGFNMHKVQTTANMFDHCANLTAVDFGESFSAPDLTNMSAMFQFCISYENPNLEDIISVGKEVDISRMFYNMDKVSDERDGQEYAKASAYPNAIYSINFGHFLDYESINEEGEIILTKVTACEQIFSGLNHITSLDLSSWNVSGIKSCYGMCAWCQNLEHIRFSKNPDGVEDAEDEGWYMPEVTNMSFMFYECDKIVDGNFIGKLRTGPKLETLSNAFCKMDNVEVIDLAGIDPTSLTNIESLVRLDKKLHTLKLETWRGRAKKIDRMKQTFDDCNSLKRLDMGYWGVSEIKVQDYLRIDGTFKNVNSLEYLDISGWKIDKVEMPIGILKKGTLQTVIMNDAELHFSTNYELNYSNNKNLHTVQMKNFKSDNMTKLLFSNCTGLTSADFTGANLPKMTSFSLSGCTGLTSADLTGVNFPELTSLSLSGCQALEEGKLAGAKLPKLTALSFKNCKAMVTADLSRIEAPLLTTAESMFEGCSALENVVLKDNGFDGLNRYKWMFKGCTSLTGIAFLNDLNVRPAASVNMSYMFENCTGLTNLAGVNSSVFANATDFSGLFKGCTGLGVVDASRWDISKATVTKDLFMNCTGLTSLDISNWSMGTSVDVTNMFSGCSNLTTIFASDRLPYSAENTSVFSGCNLLCGGNGTLRTNRGADKDQAKYARIDAEGTLGYFTQR